MKKYIKLCLLVFLIIPCIIFSQDNSNSKSKNINLKGWHSIGINLGVIDQTTEVTIDPLNVSNKMNFQASLSYNYWVNNEAAFEANLGFINSTVNNEVTIYGIEQKTAVVIPYHLGIKYCPEFAAIPGNVRPFGRILVGAVTGSATEERVSYNLVKSSTMSQTVLSTKVGVGADAIIDKYLRFGLSVDYLYMPDFDKSVGTRKNYSGVNFSFVFGAMF